MSRRRQRTLELDGQKLKIVSTQRTSLGNPCGYYIKINDSDRIYANVLERAVAESIAITKWQRGQVEQRRKKELLKRAAAALNKQCAEEEAEYLKDIKEALKRYVETGELQGGFLTAVLENNLRETFQRADVHNLENLEPILKYVMTKIPYRCWGSKERVAAWIEAGGLGGQHA